MADTTYTSGVTVISADTMNDLNRLHYTILSDPADAAAVRTALGLVIGTNVQAYDADLTTWAGITPAANVGTFLATPSSANLRAAITDETGTGALVFATAPTFAGNPNGTITSGTYTPTASNQTGGAASAFISGDAAYTRIGSRCTVYGALAADFMTNAASTFDIDLPFTPVTFAGGDLYGGIVSAANFLNTVFVTGNVTPVVAGTTVRISMPALNATTQSCNFQFTFVIA